MPKLCSRTFDKFISNPACEPLATSHEPRGHKLCETNPIYGTPKMDLTHYSTNRYDNNSGLLTMQKQTQTNPIYGERSRTIYGEPACPELVEGVEPTCSELVEPILYASRSAAQIPECRYPGPGYFHPELPATSHQPRVTSHEPRLVSTD